jgi:hypothetical protein
MPRFRVRKFLRLVKPLGSQGLSDSLGKVMADLERLRRNGEISAEPNHVFLVLDAFGGGERIAAAAYNNRFLDFEENDRKRIDRLLQTGGAVEPVVVFEDDSVLDLGFTPGVDYTNDDLIAEIFQPRTPRALELAETAVYTRRVPGETLGELIVVPRCIRSVLARLLQLAGGTEQPLGGAPGEGEMLKRYGRRSPEQKTLDAKTLTRMIFAYASDAYPDVQARAKGLAANYAILFNRPEDMEALVTLKKHLRVAVEKTMSQSNVELMEQIDRAIEYRDKRKQRAESPEQERWKQIIRDNRAQWKQGRSR